LPATAKIANRRRAGTTSRKSSSRLIAKSVCWNDRPVILPPRWRQTHDKASADRVSLREDNRDDDRCRLLSCENTYGSPGYNDIDFLPDELSNDLGCALAASLRPSNLDPGGPTLDPAEFAQPVHESGNPLVLNRGRRRAQEPDGSQTSFVVPKSPSGFVTAAGQSIGIKSQRRSSKRSFGENTTRFARITGKRIVCWPSLRAIAQEPD